MKKINFDKLNERNEFSLSNYIGGIEMEFIKKGKNYLIKNSNGRIVSEEEKIKLENKELILQDMSSNNCQQETTKKIKENKKRIAEIEKENAKINIDLQPIDSERVAKYIKEQTALHKEVDNDTIEETNTIKE